MEGRRERRGEQRRGRNERERELTFSFVFVSVRYIELGPCPPCSVQITLPCRCGESKVRPRSFLGRVESKADLSSSLPFPFLSSRVTFFIPSHSLRLIHQVTRSCYVRRKEEAEGLSEIRCERVCRALRSCSKHQCGRTVRYFFFPSVPLFPIQSCFSIFTPPFGCYGISRERQRNSSLTFSFSFPESQCCPLAYKGVKSKGKKRAGDLEDEDEGGWHTCSLVCGKPVSSLTLFSNPRTRREGETSERFADFGSMFGSSRAGTINAQLWITKDPVLLVWKLRTMRFVSFFLSPSLFFLLSPPPSLSPQS